MERPVRIENPDLTKVFEAIEEEIDFFDSPDFNEDGIGDHEYRIYEALLTSLYGQKYFDFKNSKHD